MRAGSTARRVSYVFLCVIPFLVMPLVGARPLRIPGIYQTVGIVLFAAMVVCAGLLGGWRSGGSGEPAPRLRAAGALLVAPFAMVALLWIGLATPWDATPPENVMRYAVLLVASIAVTAAFVVLQDGLADAGERTLSTLGLALNLLAGSGYLVWISFQLGTHAALAHGPISPAIRALGDVFDTLLFAACALTYLVTALFAESMGRAHWLGRGAARAYVVLNLLALAFLAVRGLSFPDPTASSTPWYMRPGFIAGIPAIPWLMPYLLGVVLLRRAGDERA